ncbi:MAG: molybdenum cofactor guanylyltransferase [Trueperaceae bacterium]|nr:molybdenum cofactor guanylyltransferase [Trueperaceae bacterium]
MPLDALPDTSSDGPLGTPPPPTAWYGAILADGASRRFGPDKAFAVVDGARMIDAAATALAGATSRVALLGSPERVAAVADRLPAGVAPLADDLPGRGPMAGLATVLARHPRSWAALLAVDLPRLPPDWWPCLAARHRPGAAAIVARHPNGRWEPTAALYHGALAAEAAALLASGEAERLGFRGWFEALEAAGRLVAVPVAELPPGALTNVNRPEDAVALTARSSTQLDASASQTSDASINAPPNPDPAA